MKITPINNNSINKSPNFKAKLTVTPKAGQIIGRNIRDTFAKENINPALGFSVAQYIDQQLNVLAESIKEIQPRDYDVTLDASQAYKRHEALYGSADSFDNEMYNDLELYFNGSPKGAAFTLNIEYSSEQIQRLYHVIKERILHPERYY